MGIGVAGVGLLLGVDAPSGGAALVGGLMVVVASMGYALGAWYSKRAMTEVHPIGVVAGTMAAAALIVSPLAALDAPAHAPSIDGGGVAHRIGGAGHRGLVRVRSTP